MERRVVWSEPASEDLDAIAAYIARDSESYAAAFVQKVREAAASLVIFSERGQVVPEYGDKAIRELLVGHYRLIYHLSNGTVFILRRCRARTLNQI